MKFTFGHILHVPEQPRTTVASELSFGSYFRREPRYPRTRTSSLIDHRLIGFFNPNFAF